MTSPIRYSNEEVLACHLLRRFWRKPHLHACTILDRPIYDTSGLIPLSHTCRTTHKEAYQMAMHFYFFRVCQRCAYPIYPHGITSTLLSLAFRTIIHAHHHSFCPFSTCSVSSVCDHSTWEVGLMSLPVSKLHPSRTSSIRKGSGTITSGQPGVLLFTPTLLLTRVFNRIILLNAWIFLLCVPFVFLQESTFTHTFQPDYILYHWL